MGPGAVPVPGAGALVGGRGAAAARPDAGQREQAHLAVDPATGAVSAVLVEEDPAWLELLPGVPAWSADGRLVRIADVADGGADVDTGDGGTRVLAVGDRVLTDGRLHVRAVLDVGPGDVLVSASAGAGAEAPETGEVHVYRVTEAGAERLSEGVGVHGAVRAGR